jgi:NADH-quinone oxidoreductase subunit L
MDAGTLGVILAVVGIVGAGLTAFYMARLLFRAFWGPEPEGGYAHAPHAPTWVMSAPVVALAVLAAGGGLIQVPGAWHLLDDWLEPTLFADPGLEVTTGAELVVGIASVALAIAGIALAWWVFVADPGRRRRLAPAAPGARALLRDQWRVDEVIEEGVVQPGRDLADVLTATERRGVQGSVEGLVVGLVGAARGLSALQSGLVRAYAFAMIAGTALVGAIFALVR